MKSLNTLAVIAINGADAKTYLQGQISNDVNILGVNTALLASCNSAQGRVQCVLTLLQRDEAVLAVLPRSILEMSLARLRKYLLRSKVEIEDLSNELRCYSATREQLHAATLDTPDAPGSVLHNQGITVMRWWDNNSERYLAIRAGETCTTADEEWLLADIRAGLPQILPNTHEAFVAQMLNLDLLNGISFNKGCYTGQEIIARAHFRGAVKRRMFRLSGNFAPPAPATRILLQADGTHAGDVVISAATDNGSELLAVLNVVSKDVPLCLESDRSTILTMNQLPYLSES